MNETTNGANCSPEQGAIDTTWKPKILAFGCFACPAPVALTRNMS